MSFAALLVVGPLINIGDLSMSAESRLKRGDDPEAVAKLFNQPVEAMKALQAALTKPQKKTAKKAVKKAK